MSVVLTYPLSCNFSHFISVSCGSASFHLCLFKYTMKTNIQSNNQDLYSHVNEAIVCESTINIKSIHFFASIFNWYPYRNEFIMANGVQVYLKTWFSLCNENKNRYSWLYHVHCQSGVAGLVLYIQSSQVETYVNAKYVVRTLYIRCVPKHSSAHVSTSTCNVYRFYYTSGFGLEPSPLKKFVWRSIGYYFLVENEYSPVLSFYRKNIKSKQSEGIFNWISCHNIFHISMPTLQQQNCRFDAKILWSDDSIDNFSTLI